MANGGIRDLCQASQCNTSCICCVAHWKHQHWRNWWDLWGFQILWSKMVPAISSRALHLAAVSCLKSPKIRHELASTWTMVLVMHSSSPSVALRIDAKLVRVNVWGLHIVSWTKGNSISSCWGTCVFRWCLYQFQMSPNIVLQHSMLLTVEFHEKYGCLWQFLCWRYLEWSVHCFFWNLMMIVGASFTPGPTCMCHNIVV